MRRISTRLASSSMEYRIRYGPRRAPIQALELPLERLAHATRRGGQVTEGELDDRGHDTRRDALQVPPRRGGHDDLVAHRSRVGTLNSARICSCVWTRPAATSAVASADRFADPWLRQPEQRLLQRLPLVHADQHRGRGAVLRDRDLLVSDRRGIDQVVEPVLHLGDRKRLHGHSIGANNSLLKAVKQA